MPVYKIVWQFAEANGASFTETFYKSDSTPQSATQAGPQFINSRLALLDSTCRLIAIRAADVDSSRLTYIRTINQAGLLTGLGGPAPPGTAVVIRLAGTTKGSRKLWMRGCNQTLIVRGQVSGQDQPPAALNQKLLYYLAGLNVNGYGLRQLGNGGLSTAKFPISNFDGTTNKGVTILTVNAINDFAPGQRIIVAQVPQKDMPSLKGQFTVQAVNGGLITIPYRMPQNGTITQTVGYIKHAQYPGVDIFSNANSGFAYYGNRATKSPLPNSRGARRAQRLRLSL